MKIIQADECLMSAFEYDETRLGFREEKTRCF